MPHVKKIFFVIVALLAALVFGWYFSDYSKKEEVSLKELNPHFYQDTTRDISRVKIKIFYAVPRNKLVYGEWNDLVTPVLNDSIEFHKIQFRGSSELSYEIYSQPFMLKNDSIFYDTENTNRGNPEGLKSIVLEIEKRESEFLKVESGVFPVIAIIYEGVGASGTDGATILSRTFLTDNQYMAFRSSLFYHEFGHALGLPDQYDLEHSIPYSNDIMGAGRRRSIDFTYIDRVLLKEMGVVK